VITANAMPFLRLFDRAPLIQPILFKTAVYWVAVFFSRLIERFVHFSVIAGNSPSDFGAYLATSFSWYRFTAISLWILVLFLIGRHPTRRGSTPSGYLGAPFSGEDYKGEA
jgi:hypothetical protein